mgnify:CR=1 FL=1
MSRFNTSRKPIKTHNHANGKASSIDKKTELYTAVCTASLQNKFYEKSPQSLQRIQSLIESVDPEFVQKLAIYARNDMNLRSIPIVIAVELAKAGKLTHKTVSRIIKRPDEITEMLAYYVQRNERNGIKKLNKLSKAIHKGIKYIFESGKFDEYQYAKYNRDGEIRLRDALFITHPKPSIREQHELFRKIANDNLKTPDTWEVKISEAGSDSVRKREAWEELILSRKLPYMASVRNLRNVLESNVSNAAFDQICNYISNPVAVQKSRMFPFRFMSAYREIDQLDIPRVSAVKETLEAAAKESSKNLPGFGTDTSVFVAIDTSGSMSRVISPRSRISYQDIALTMAAIIKERCTLTTLGIFGTTFKEVMIPNTPILETATKMMRISGDVGHLTHAHLSIDHLIKNNISIDKVIMFSDMQVYGTGGQGEISSAWKKYKRDINPNSELILFDLAGYGTMPLDIRGDKTYVISGWSDKTFNIISDIKEGRTAIQKIEQIPL